MPHRSVYYKTYTSNLRRMLKLILLLCAAGIIDGIEIDKPRISYNKENQVIFRERGIVVNQATFLHYNYHLDIGHLITDSLFVLKALIKNGEDARALSKDRVDEVIKEDSDRKLLNSSMTELQNIYLMTRTDDIISNDYNTQMINYTYNRVKEFISILPRDSNLASSELSHTLVKRTIAEEDLIAVMKESIAIAEKTTASKRKRRFIFGGWALGKHYLEVVPKLNQFGSQITNLTRLSSKVVDSMVLLGRHQARLSFDTKILLQFQKLMGHGSARKKMAAANFLDSEFKDLFRRIQAGVTAAQHKRLASELIPGVELIDIFNRMLEYSKRMGCEVLISQPSDLYQVEVSYIFNEENSIFELFIHIPMIPADSRLILKQFIPFPILQSLEVNATIIPDVGEGKYIAVLQDSAISAQSAAKQYRIFTEAELNSCRRLGILFVCAGRNTLRTDIGNTCIGNLNNMDAEGIKRHCTMKIQKPIEFVARLDLNKWMISSHNSYTVSPVCKGLKIAETIRIEGQCTLEMPENCIVNLKQNYLSTDVNIKKDYNTNVNTWGRVTNIFEGVVNITEFKIAARNLFKSMDEFDSTDLTHLKLTEMKFEKSKTFTEDVGSFFGGISSFFGSIFGGFGFIASIFSLTGASILTFVLGFMGLGCCYKHQLYLVVWKLFCARSKKAPHVSFKESCPTDDQPPPYNPYINRAATPIPTEMWERPSSAMSVTSTYKPIRTAASACSLPQPEYSFPEGRERAGNGAELGCNPGAVTRDGMRLSDFMCSIHMPESGCLGGFKHNP